MLVASVEIWCCFLKKLSDYTSFGIHNGRWQKNEKYFFEKMLEQRISFNFLKSKVSDLAAIYQTNLSLMGKKGANFIEFLFMVLFPVII